MLPSSRLATVEVLDLNAAKRLRSITGCNKPQGVLYLPKGNLLCVANGGDGRLRIYDGASFTPLVTIGSLEDADNLRYDPRRDRLYVGYGDGRPDGQHQAPRPPRVVST